MNHVQHRPYHCVRPVRMSPPVAVFCRHTATVTSVTSLGWPRGQTAANPGFLGSVPPQAEPAAAPPAKDRRHYFALLHGCWHQPGGGFRAGVDARPELYGQPGTWSPQQTPSLRLGLNPCCHGMGSDGGCCGWLWRLAAEETLPRRPASRLGSRTGTGHPCSRYRCTLRELGSGWEDGGSGQERLN